MTQKKKYYDTLINSVQLYKLIYNKNLILFDCRFSLYDSSLGEKQYKKGHIPNALYAHLEKNLSSKNTSSGRHPLPKIDVFCDWLSMNGVLSQNQIVCYDNDSGVFASRLWWLLREIGHKKVAVLNGGIREWIKKNYPINRKKTSKDISSYIRKKSWSPVMTEQIKQNLVKKKFLLIDARKSERYLGLEEEIDPIAGHIPNSLNRFYENNLDKNLKFKNKKHLNTQFKKLIGTYKPDMVVHQCGSGITACHNLLSMEISGLKGSKLYAGSWSEWIIKNKDLIEKL